MKKPELEHIVSACYQEIYVFCLRKVNYNEHLAEDITQDVFLLLQERHDLLVNENVRAWLYSVADKKVKEAYKKEQKNQRVVSIEQSDLEIPCDCDLLALLEKSVSDDEIERCKAKVLNSLLPTEKDLYRKIYTEQKIYRKIAEEDETTEKTIRLRAFRLRRRIREVAKTMLCSLMHFFSLL